MHYTLYLLSTLLTERRKQVPFIIEINDLHFCAAHRIEGHPKCGRLHGHNYLVSVQLLSNDLNAAGMVMDFGDVKAPLKRFLDSKLDHRFLVSQANVQAQCVYYAAASSNFAVMDDLVVLPVQHTTAEELARYFYHEFEQYLPETVRLYSVTVQETASSSATYMKLG